MSDDWWVIRDGREQQGYGWNFDRRTRGCAGTEIATLKTGDYAVKGLEDLLVVERKANVKEYAGNVFQDRFHKELDRMKGVPFAYVILEFPLRDVLDYPRVACVPHSARKQIQLSGSGLLRAHIKLEQRFPWVRFHFAGNAGKEFATSLFKRVVEYAPSAGRKHFVSSSNNPIPPESKPQ